MKTIFWSYMIRWRIPQIDLTSIFLKSLSIYCTALQDLSFKSLDSRVAGLLVQIWGIWVGFGSLGKQYKGLPA